MSAELETAAGASAGGWLRWRRRQADIPPGTPCANCGTPLAGAYCHGCGQLAEDFHKSVWKLAREALESFFHFDGRLARTLPALAIRPGRLTRDYLDGRRASQVPPLRLFLVVLLLTFLVGQCSLGDGAGQILHRGAGGAEAPAAEAVERARAEIDADDSLTDAERRAADAALDGDWTALGAAFEGVDGQAQGAGAIAFQNWITRRAEAVQAEPGRFMMLLGVWAQRVAILMLPVSALILTGLFFWRREVFVFDHLIFSMHSLSSQLLLTTVAMALAAAVGAAAWWLLWLSPAHLFVHMRGTYGGGIVATLLRMFALFTATSVAAGFMLILWLALAFNEMTGG